eukprot:COSAG05_NODE_513_length_9084_cov_5.373957_9_plen_327_part_00
MLMQEHVAGEVADYRAASSLLTPELQALANAAEITPHWVSSTQFWYSTAARAVPEDHSTLAQLQPKQHGTQFVLVDASSQPPRRSPAFDHAKLAAGLAAAASSSSDSCASTAVNPNALPFRHITFKADRSELHFQAFETSWVCQLPSYVVRAAAGDVHEAGGLSSLPCAEVLSPDGSFAAIIRDHNLWLRDTTTGEHLQLSTDGAEGYEYAAVFPSPADMIEQGRQRTVFTPALQWSPDGRYIATSILDVRNCPTLTMVDSNPPEQFRPKAYEYFYPLPGRPASPPFVRACVGVCAVGTDISLSAATHARPELLAQSQVPRLHHHP